MFIFVRKWKKISFLCLEERLWFVNNVKYVTLANEKFYHYEFEWTVREGSMIHTCNRCVAQRTSENVTRHSYYHITQCTALKKFILNIKRLSPSTYSVGLFMRIKQKKSFSVRCYTYKVRVIVILIKIYNFFPRVILVFV